MEWHSITVAQLFKILNSSEKGLSQARAQQLLKRVGPNEIKRRRKVSALSIFLSQFKNVLVGILFLALFLCLILGKLLDASIISIFILIIGVLGFVEEFKAEKAIEKIRKLAAPSARVLRDGKEKEISSLQLVPGDVVFVSKGDIVPADLRVLQALNLEVDESFLTGESLPVRKIAQTLRKDTPLPNRINMLYLGTVVTNGRGKAIVVATGSQTEMGRLAKFVEEPSPEFPLKSKLRVFGRQLALIFGVAALVTLLAGVLRGEQILEMVMITVALAVSTIPEALPLIFTVTLALGALKLVARNALIRKLPALETLGSVNVICCDKTGTLTKNEMTVKQIWCEGKLFEVSGQGYKPEGEILLEGKKVKVENFPKLKVLLQAANLCNTASLESDPLGNWWIVGSPTEGALLTLCRKAGLVDLRRKLKLLAENPFDASRKLMSVVYEEGKRRLVYVKGAPEQVVQRCKLSKKQRMKILEQNRRLAAKGLRVLAFAWKKAGRSYDAKSLEKGLNFLGLVGMQDPVRPEAKEAIKICQQAGTRVVMVTGDQLPTALHVAQELGLPVERVVEGRELDKMSDEELARIVGEVSIFARISPEHKLRIVQALKRKQKVVAMTGDGVNDAPALKKADVGIAMGIKGTDVAKEASDVVLLDDNFASILAAVKEGRRIFSNLKKSTLALLSTSVGEILFIVAAILAGLPLPLIAIQLLWINIVTEGIPAVGLAFEKADPGLLQQKPRKPKEQLLDGILYRLLGIGALIGSLSFFVFVSYIDNPSVAKSMGFTTLVMLELFVLLSCRSLNFSLRRIGFFSNRVLLAGVCVAFLLQILAVQALYSIFDIVPLSLEQWLFCIALGSSVLWLSELRKNISFLRFLPF